MRIGPLWGMGFRIGRDFASDARLVIFIGVGFRRDAPLGEVRWRRTWTWSSASLPGFLYRQYLWRGFRIVVPVGYRIAGRYRVLI